MEARDHLTWIPVKVFRNLLSEFFHTSAFQCLEQRCGTKRRHLAWKANLINLFMVTVKNVMVKNVDGWHARPHISFSSQLIAADWNQRKIIKVRILALGFLSQRGCRATFLVYGSGKKEPENRER